MYKENHDKTPFTLLPPLFYNYPRALFWAVDFLVHFISGVTNMVYITLKSIKSLKNEIDSFTRKNPGKTNQSRPCLHKTIKFEKTNREMEHM
jgi:hypothetical protein